MTSESCWLRLALWYPVEREALLSRLNRAANEYPDLWEVAGKLVVPVAVAVVTLVGVVLTVIVRG